MQLCLGTFPAEMAYSTWHCKSTSAVCLNSQQLLSLMIWRVVTFWKQVVNSEEQLGTSTSSCYTANLIFRLLHRQLSYSLPQSSWTDCLFADSNLAIQFSKISCDRKVLISLPSSDRIRRTKTMHTSNTTIPGRIWTMLWQRHSGHQLGTAFQW